MSTTLFSGLTGVGIQPWTVTETNVILRIEVTNPGSGGSLFPFGTPQRYGGLGWISPNDHIPSGFDGVFPHDMDCVVNPITWIDTLHADLDWTDLQAHLFGISGFAFGLNPGVVIDVYVTHF